MCFQDVVLCCCHEMSAACWYTFVCAPYISKVLLNDAADNLLCYGHASQNNVNYSVKIHGYGVQEKRL